MSIDVLPVLITGGQAGRRALGALHFLLMPQLLAWMLRPRRAEALRILCAVPGDFWNDNLATAARNRRGDA
ncbi:MAG: hypothetical protein AB7K09_10925 [Planctomycetota bacterium]